jgi:formylmethanofuran dehydrogenase subunit D
VLVISYTGAEAPPETTTEPPAPADTVPCDVTYTVTPSNPQDGDAVTITARATDNQALAYVSILRGYTELARREATGDSETVLEVSYTETATLPSLSYTVIADDIGDEFPCRKDFIVPVTGSGSAPHVTITADWEFSEVVPERYRLIEGDGQIVIITATASDPDGIEHLTVSINSVPHDFTYSGETSVSETLTFVNDIRSRTTFSFYASATDREGLTSTDHGESYDIASLGDISFLWNAALGFHNFSTGRLPWTRMVQVFGADECWVYEDWDWKHAWAWIYYHAAFKDIADGGHCFGFSTMSNEFYRGRISPSSIESTLAAHELDKNNTYTKEYIEARQAAQLGADIMISKIDQWVTWVAEVGLHLRLLGYIEDDLESDSPGIIAIREGDGGHAIVPWMTRHMNDGTTQVYVYDSNYAHDTSPDAIHNPAADFTDFAFFPYMEFHFNDWSYAFSWNSTAGAPSEVWNDKLFYYNYEDALGNAGRHNKLGDAADAPYVTDQSIPSIIDYLVGVFGGNADVYYEDEKGRVTGIKEGKLLEEIPGVVPLVLEKGVNFTNNVMYALPVDAKLTINVEGNGDGEYYLGLMGKNSCYSIEEKSILPGGRDRYVISPDSGAVEHRLRIIPEVADDNFIIRFAHIFGGRVETLDSDHIIREYLLEGVSVGEGDDFSVLTEDGGDSMVVTTEEGEVTFDAVTRSSESVDYADEGISYIPESREDDVTVTTGETAVFYPEDWTSAEEQGEMHVLKESKYRQETTPSTTETANRVEITPTTTNTGSAGPTTVEQKTATPAPTSDQRDSRSVPIVWIAVAGAAVIVIVITVLLLRRKKS